MRFRIALCITLCGAITVLPCSANMDGSEKKTKEEKMEEKEKADDEKNVANYEKVKEFALNKYKTDPTFRDEVDAHFQDVMREHSQEAFTNNINQRSMLIAVREDTWRQHFYLYDNLLVQDHINRIGQKLVPQDSEKLFAFRVVPDPIPMARSLSTGTIYVSTGMISILDSEAELAYVLAHEMAHIQLDHWRERSMIELGEKAYNEAQMKKAARIAAISTGIGAALGGAIGRSGSAAMMGAGSGAAAGLIAGYLLNRPIKHVEWDKAQEDQADEMAFKAILNQRYDVREVPRVYLSLEQLARKDARVQLGFLGERKRVKLRMEKAQDLINNSMKAEIALAEKNGFISSSAEHRNLIAELKRDNGILAYYHDMFDMARANLADAAAIRDNDPAVHYFYAKVLSLVGRTDEDAKLAKEHFFRATKADTRNQNYGAHLHLALMTARERGVDPKQVEAELDTYVTDYVRWNMETTAMRAYPPNLDSIYEYISIYGGDQNWRPKVPDLRELQEYRSISDSAPPPPAQSTAEVTETATPAAPASTPAQTPVQKAKAKSLSPVSVKPAVQK